MTSRLTHLIFILALLGVVALGCAEGQTNDPEDAGTDNAVDTHQRDTHAPTDTLSVPDTGSVDTHAADTAVCTVGEATCTDTTTLRTCPNGSAYLDTACPHGCAQGACLPEPLCTANQTWCSAYNALSTCAADGQSATEQNCGAGRCLDDHCGTGAATGTLCTADTECAGETCLCPSGECVGSALEGGYCTVSGCDTRGCAPNEVCVNADPTGAGAHVCVLDCGVCNREGFACSEVPVGAGAEAAWADACYPTDLGEVGAECTTDADCVGGICLLESLGGPIEGGYCSAPCETHTGCPSSSACMSVSGYRNNTGFCALRCVNVDGSIECPEERPTTFTIDCRIIGAADGGNALNVCFQG